MWFKLLVMFVVSAVISLAVAIIIEGIFHLISWVDRPKSANEDQNIKKG